mgnify:FL=1
MKILVLNCGSSSIKYKLFDMDRKEVIAQGGIEKIGLKDSFLKFTLPSGEKKVLEKDIPEHTVGVEFILNTLTSPEYGAIKSLDEINAVGHRMVHGGEKFSESVRLTPEVLAAFTACNDLAPLHNPANLKGVNAISAILPNVPQIGVFDTAFHQTMPKHAYLYAVPYELYEKYGVRRYGFHGTSHRYVSQRAHSLLNLAEDDSGLVVAHLGNGASICAVRNGQSVDTSMGMTPLEGLMMGTRSGDVDFGAMSWVASQTNQSLGDLERVVNKESGLLGISGLSSDLRVLEKAWHEGHERAQLAIKTFVHRIARHIAGHAASLHRLDGIIFTGGIGENSSLIRRLVMEHLAVLGVEIDTEMNNRSNSFGERIVSSENARVICAVIPTNEEKMIALDAIHLGKVNAPAEFA